MESSIDVLIYIEVLWCSVAIFIKDLWETRYTVNAETYYLLLIFISHANYIVAITIPNKMKRGDNILLSIVTQLLFFTDIILKVLKSNFFVFIDCFVDSIDYKQYFFIAASNTSLTSNITAKSSSTVYTC